MKNITPTFILAFMCLAMTAQSFQDNGRNYMSSNYNGIQIRKGDLDPSFKSTVLSLSSQLDGKLQWDEVTVPIVFHVLYQDQKDSIEESRILDQLASLNDDFAGLTEAPPGDERDVDGSFAKAKADTKIRFCIPAIGILPDFIAAVDYRRIDSLFDNGFNRVKRAELGIPPITPRRCLNVWITPLPGNRAGFAQFPMGKPNRDGIVIDPDFLLGSSRANSRYSEGKTLTHLVGTYLGLEPLWTDGECADDGIDDTPTHNQPNRGRPGMGHVSACAGNPLEMTMNFMDAANDSLLHMFTEGQATWMRTVLMPRVGPRSRMHSVLVKCDYSAPLDFSKNLTRTKGEGNKASLTPTIYPNPAENVVNVSFSSKLVGKDMEQITVTSLGGRQVIVLNNLTTSSGKITIPTAEWKPGVYVVTIRLTDQSHYVKKLIVQ